MTQFSELSNEVEDSYIQWKAGGGGEGSRLLWNEK